MGEEELEDPESHLVEPEANANGLEYTEVDSVKDDKASRSDEEPKKKKKKRMKRSGDSFETELLTKTIKLLEERDEYDTFGDFVSNEIRNLPTKTLRNRLKNKILRDILEVTREDC